MEKIIKAAVERGASDLHIKAGDVFRARINGKLVPLTKQRLTPDQTRAIALKLISSDEDRARIDRLRDFDCSWGMPGVGPVPGQRAAPALVVHDRHAGDSVHRADHRVAPAARGAEAGGRVGARAGAGDRRERKREELDRGGDGAPHQPDPAQARRDDREPDRVPPPRPELLDHPARGRGRHREPRRSVSAPRCARTPTWWCSARSPTPTRSIPRIKGAETGHLVIASMPTPDVRHHDRARPHDPPARGARDRPDASVGGAPGDRLPAAPAREGREGPGGRGRGADRHARGAGVPQGRGPSRASFASTWPTAGSSSAPRRSSSTSPSWSRPASSPPRPAKAALSLSGATPPAAKKGGKQAASA